METSYIYHLTPYEPIGWKDRVVEYPARFQEVLLENGLIDHIPKPGEVFQKGTLINSKNLNHMEAGISGLHLAFIGLMREHAAMQNAISSSPVMSSSKNLGISIFQGFFVPS